MSRFIDTRDVVSHFAPRYAKGRVLDIGSGPGKYRGIFTQVASEYVATDIEAAPGVVVEDARALSFPDASFDTVVSFQALEHIDDTARAVGEMYRVLRPGGYAIVSMPFLFPQHGHPSDFHRFTVEGARFHFERAGFRIIEKGTQGSVFSVIAEMLRCVIANPYGPAHGRMHSWIVRRLFGLLKTMDRRGWWQRSDIYGNVYLIAQKP